MDEDLNEGFVSDDAESSADPKICTECEREFEGEGGLCPDCEGSEEADDMA